MKINYITGCVHNTLQINGNDSDTIYIDDLRDVCKAIIDKTTDKDFLEEIVIDYLYHTKREDLNEYDSYKCETCGDYVEMFEKEI